MKEPTPANEEAKDEETNSLLRRDDGGDRVPDLLAVAEPVANFGEVADVEAEHSVEAANPTSTEHSIKPPAEHSAAPLKLVPTEHSVKAARAAGGKRKTERLSRTESASQTIEKKSNVVQLNTQRGVVFEKSKWKRSSKKPGYLIRRLPGYSIAETEYGVSYLWVISRKPDRTTADNSVHPGAGYFNWQSLESSGLFVKERKSDRRDKTAVG